MPSKEYRELQEQKKREEKEQKTLEREEEARFVSRNEDPDVDREENKWSDVYKPEETRNEYHNYKKPRER